MVKTMFLKCWEIARKKPLTLWGISLLGVLLMCLAQTVGVLPIISIPLTLVLEAGMAAIYLKGYMGERIEVEDVFAGFKGDFWRVLGGMAWMSLWVFIWSLIPIVGPVFGVIKSYEYRFAPFILMTRPEVPATEAIKLSQKQTEGYKGSMFLCDLIVWGAIVAVCLVLVLLGLIPFVGYGFWAALPLFMLAASAVSPLGFGLLRAAFYVESETNAAVNGSGSTPAGAPASAYCAQCGSPKDPEQKFCSRCGARQGD